MSIGMLKSPRCHVALWLAVIACAGLATEPAPSPAGDPLSALEQRIRSGEIPNVHSLIVVRGERTLAEWYFEGPDETMGRPLGIVKFGPEKLHDVRSVTKTVVSMLFGIAQAQGVIKDIDAPAVDFFPEYQDLQTPERRRVTLRHLLTMTSGLRWDETTYPYTDPRNSEIAMNAAPDPLRFALEQAFDAVPGAEFRYSAGSVALVAAIITRTTKMPLDAFASAELFAPLGISQFDWVKDARGTPRAASGLRLLSGDMVKIGQLMLHHGKHGTRQVVPEAWMNAAASPLTVVEVNKGCGIQYGYFTWVVRKCSARPAPGSFGALGNGGQLIWVVPERDLVMVVTAGLYDDPRQRTLIQQIRPAIAQSLRN